MRVRYSGSKKRDLAASAERLFGGDVVIEPEIQERALAWLPEPMRFGAAQKDAEPENSDPEEQEVAIASDEQSDAEIGRGLQQAA